METIPLSTFIILCSHRDWKHSDDLSGNWQQRQEDVFKTKVHCLVRSPQAAMFPGLVEDTEALIEPKCESCALGYLKEMIWPRSLTRLRNGNMLKMTPLYQNGLFPRGFTSNLLSQGQRQSSAHCVHTWTHILRWVGLTPLWHFEWTAKGNRGHVRGDASLGWHLGSAMSHHGDADRRQKPLPVTGSHSRQYLGSDTWGYRGRANTAAPPRTSHELPGPWASWLWTDSVTDEEWWDIYLWKGGGEEAVRGEGEGHCGKSEG